MRKETDGFRSRGGGGIFLWEECALSIFIAFCHKMIIFALNLLHYGTSFYDGTDGFRSQILI